MSTKRKTNANGEEISGRERKKQKMAVARTIQVQQSDPSSIPRRSGGGVVSSMQGLPSALDVKKFAEARAFEIDAMEKAIKSASGASTQRAWQALPNHLRRRAASHDVRRVPVRLREKAKAEMDPVKKKTFSRKLSRAGKNKQIAKTEDFLKRQRDKSWLETHIWHAKRMKMENMWGYRLALHPTEKAYRPSHRASVQGSVLHDASYYSTIELKGPESMLIRILELCSDLQGVGPGAVRWLSGARICNTHFYKSSSYPFGLLGPVSILWKPIPTGEQGTNVTVNRKGKDKESTNTEGENGIRLVWLRIHPAMFDDVWSELERATRQVIDYPRTSAEQFEIEIEDRRGQINAFEIMGPKSSQVIRGALTPTLQDGREEFKTFWAALSNLQSSASIPRGTIIGFTVIDPRLNFPPHNAKAEYKENSDMVFPNSKLAQSEIWDQDIRKTLSAPRYKKKDLDGRRSKNLVPGTSLRPERQDDRVPILLIQRSLETSENESQGIHGWTILLPAGWSMAFFSSLMFTGTRIAGQRERQTQAYEAGAAYFPRDYPFSPSYERWALKREVEERSAWLRRPPAKRVNYDKLGTRSPWRADWGVVLGLRRPNPVVEHVDGSDDFVATQRELPMDVDKGQPTEMKVDRSNLEPWLFRGVEVKEIIARLAALFNPGFTLLDEINRLRRRRSLEPLDPIIKGNDLLQHALVNVQVMVFKEGVPEDMAIIYSVPVEEAQTWERLLDKSKMGMDAASATDKLQLVDRRPPPEHIIGYVTTGHYSLSRGQGFALGAVPLAKFLTLKEQQQSLNRQLPADEHPFLVKVRNVNGQQCRPAYLKLFNWTS